MADQNSQYMAMLTAVGEAKLANATALGVNLNITQLGVGDANGVEPMPSRTQTALINERRRAPLNQLSIDPNNSAIIIAEQVIPEDIGGWWIREIGLYDEAGDLVAVSNCPPTFKPELAQGSGRTQVVRLNILVSSTQNIQLKIDPSVVLATRAYVDSKHATEPEAKAGTVADKFSSPLRVAQYVSGKTQNSPIDSGPGKLLTVGAFGLGSSGVPSLGADFNTVTETGFYLSVVTALNAPVAGEHFQVVHIERNASYSSQIAISSQRLGVIYFRNRVGAAWGAWLELFHKGNLSPVESTRKVEAGNGLSGGGALSADRSISLGMPSKLGRTSINSVTASSHTHELDVQQSDYDATAGRLALVGGFGLGANLGSTTAREDFNDATLTTGWYRMSSAALNAPASGFHVLNVLAYTSDFCMQVAYPMAPGAGAYIRERAGGVWGSWGKLIHSGNAALLPLLTALAPETDNNRTLGTAAKRWSTVYAGTGTINTSDGREKTAVRTLTAAELSATKQLAREIGAYRFLSAVAEKGDAAREHVGMTVQRAIEVMEAHGLDPFGYGFICYDSWPEEWRDVPPVMDTRPTGEVTAEGDPVMEEFELEPARRELFQTAGDRYSFRPDELLMFIAAGLEARIAALEQAV